MLTRLIAIISALVGCYAAAVSPPTPPANAKEQQAAGLHAGLTFTRKQTPPTFQPGHTLPHLSQWRAVPFELAKELADNWGYALYLGRLTPNLVATLDDPDSDASKIVRLAAARPDKYKLQVTIAPAFSIRTYKKTLPPESFLLDASGNLLEGKRVFSPVAPDETFRRIGNYEAEMVRAVRKHTPISIITNGGEYGHNSAGHSAHLYEQDPRVMKAKGDVPWQEFLSDCKARKERLVRRQVKQAAPDAMYIMYGGTGGGHAHRQRYDGWDQWGFSFRAGVSDLPATSLYHGHYNTGFTGDIDLLTLLLNARAQEIAAGESFCYPWVSLGWYRKQNIGDATLYTGWLKCAYTAGALGAVAGYFGAAPHQDPVVQSLPQFLALARVHAQFTHLDEFIRDSDLLPGRQRHRWSKDLPAYELPTDHQHKRVLARKHRTRREWLVTAWAADGKAGPVTVAIDRRSRKITLEAHPAGHVYRVALAADGSTEITCLDPDPL